MPARDPFPGASSGVVTAVVAAIAMAVTLGLALGLALTGCSDSAAPEPGFRVETLGGVEHSVAGASPEGGDAGLELLWRAPDEERVLEGAEWANPTGIAVNDRFVVALDPLLSRVHMFTHAGEPAGSFGRGGEGPGELMRPLAVAVAGDSVLVVGSRGTTPLQWFDAEGEFLGSPQVAEGSVTAFAYYLPGAGVVRRFSGLGAAAAAGLRWEIVQSSGESVPMVLPGDHPLQPQVIGGGNGCWRVGVVGPRLAQVDCTFPLIRILDSEGGVLREHRIEWEPQRAADHQVDMVVDSLANVLSRAGRYLPPDMAARMVGQFTEQAERQFAWMRTMAAVTGSMSGHRVVLLEQVPPEMGGGPGTLHVLDAEGRYLVRHAFGRAVRSVGVSDTQLVVLLEDADTGLRRLEAYALP